MRIRSSTTFSISDAGMRKQVDLKLLSRLEFDSGAVVMRYEPRGFRHLDPVEHEPDQVFAAVRR
jgi:hypothetical protein